MTSNGTKTYRFEILRYDARADDPPRIDTFELAAGENMSVLDGLLAIQDREDPSLALRYSCRGAVCGSCAMSINGELNLACRIQLRNLPSRRVVVEPLPRFEIIKDLVVDMTSFWEKYEQIRPWLHAEISESKESRMSEEERDKIDQYIGCILCALCHAACPVVSMNEKFTGPAALAKLYRFVADSREDRGPASLEGENGHDGMWGCHTITRCIQACPKNVRPTDGIEGVRRKLLSDKFKRLLGKK